MGALLNRAHQTQRYLVSKSLQGQLEVSSREGLGAEAKRTSAKSSGAIKPHGGLNSEAQRGCFLEAREAYDVSKTVGGDNLFGPLY